MTAYYYVEDVDASLEVLRLIQACIKYFHGPTVVDGDELKQKLDYLDRLWTTWTHRGAGTADDSSCPSEVYKQMCAMFSANVFRHDKYNNSIVPRSTDDEIDAETMWEFKQLKPVYDAFAAFLGLDGFDEEKLVAHADGAFVEALTRRLDSYAEAERDCVKRIMSLLFQRAASLRPHLCRSTVNSLLRVLQRSNGGGARELLEVFNELVRHKLVETPVMVKVLSGLIKRNGLCHYADRLHECFLTAARVVDVDLPALIVDAALDGWPAFAANVPQLCRTLAALYFDAYRPRRCPQLRRRVRDRVVGHVTRRLLAAATSEFVDHATVAACRAYAEFCGRMIDDAAAAGGNDRECMDRVAEVLVSVYRNHRNHECVDHAGRLLRRLIGGTAVSGQQCLIGDARRMTVMEALVEDRLQTMTENLMIDKTF